MLVFVRHIQTAGAGDGAGAGLATAAGDGGSDAMGPLADGSVDGVARFCGGIAGD